MTELQTLSNENEVILEELDNKREALELAENEVIQTRQLVLRLQETERELSFQYRTIKEKQNRLSLKLRTLQIAEEQRQVEAKLADLTQQQPSFWEVTRNVIEDMTEDDNLELTFSSKTTPSNVLSQLKGLSDVRYNKGRETLIILEAQKDYETGLKDICMKQIKGEPYEKVREKMLVNPIISLLNNPQIRSSLNF